MEHGPFPKWLPILSVQNGLVLKFTNFQRRFTLKFGLVATYVH